ncbi:Hypothetical Protein FCC1311_003792 [Hondaea fermentalgiana]|uniref:Uncharacterized protein n=1 Tax=Hondaea fermentalgiana TaxID=2315210 RepID=A0A2R5G7Z6_9STRA|nr:Hypothetical Protein FCC1311_003792 [Hondaea fermentalgiana]|eukprot:GBG24161.1 Hypothetical Protein FCC1311_003792 [Hondaea fermentalgiana]
MAVFLAATQFCQAQDCVSTNSRLQEWIEDYQFETDSMETQCAEDIKALRTGLIGAHGPPIEIEIKNAACYNSCQQYARNIDYLQEISTCACEELDEVFPLADLGHSADSWCDRRPTNYLMKETGILHTWEAFDTRYCKCSVAIACDATGLQRERHFAVFAALLIIWFLS